MFAGKSGVPCGAVLVRLARAAVHRIHLSVRLGLSWLLAVVLLSGCTSFQPVDYAQNDLHAAIRAGEVVKPGDRVRVTGQDGAQRAFRVEAIRDDALIGDGVEVPIDTIDKLESRDFSAAKTAGLTGGITAGTALLLLAALAAVPLML